MVHVKPIVEKGKGKAVIVLSDSDEEDGGGFSQAGKGKGKTVILLSDSDGEDGGGFSQPEKLKGKAMVGFPDGEEKVAALILNMVMGKEGKGKAMEVVSDSEKKKETITPSTDVISRDRDAVFRNRDVASRNREPEMESFQLRERARYLAQQAKHFGRFNGEEKVQHSSSPKHDRSLAHDVDSRKNMDEQKRRAAALLAQVVANADGCAFNSDEQGSQLPSPFVKATNLVKSYESAAAGQGTFLPGAGKCLVEWVPSRQLKFKERSIPTSLLHMCVEVLCLNIEHVTSLVGVPPPIIELISKRLCSHRRMGQHALSLYLSAEPEVVIVPDCTSFTKEFLMEVLGNFSMENLRVLELGLCGRGLTDRLCVSSLAGSLPNLRTLSLNFAYQLTDIGLRILIHGAPSLSELYFKQCNMISASGLQAVANSVGQTLKTLSLDFCTGLNGLDILPHLLRMSSLESLSLSGLRGMTDSIVTELVVILGPHLLELYIAECRDLTDAAISAISLCCTGLGVLDLSDLPMLTEGAIEVLADQCRSLRTLRLNRGKFSDTAVAALITASGNCFTELSLSNVRQTGDLTLTALAKHSKGTLQQLDLSFCRKVSDQALGLLADTCLGLHEIRLFGCTQVTDFFLKGHSNPVLNVIGVPGKIIRRPFPL